jgi:hypothetical protein
MSSWTEILVFVEGPTVHLPVLAEFSNIIFTALQFITHSLGFRSRCLRWTLSNYGHKDQPLSKRSISFCTVYVLCWLALPSSKTPECAYTNKPRQIPVKLAQPNSSKTSSVLQITLPPCFIKSEFLCTPFKLSQYFVRPFVFLFLFYWFDITFFSFCQIEGDVVKAGCGKVKILCHVSN